MAPANKDNGHGNTNRNTSSIGSDFDYVDTQPFDTHLPTCNDEPRYFEDTVPFDDDDDDDVELETQPVNLAGETQVLDFAAGETQVLDFAAGETQLLDDFDGGDDDGGGAAAETQLVDEEGIVGAESEGEGSDGTQVLEDVADEEDDDVSDKQKEVPVESSDKISMGNADAVVDEHNNSSGLKPPRFTFLRAESLREAALATRNMTLKKTQSEPNAVMAMSQSCQEPLAIKYNGESFPRCSEKAREVNQECSRGKNCVEIEGVKNENMGKVASSAVRKLFNDDLPVEADEPPHSSNNFNEVEGLDNLLFYDCEFEGLSYVNSQEPGQLSQVNALDFVDKFLQDNIMEFDQDAGCVKNTTTMATTKTCSTIHVKNVEEKSKSLPSAKGKQSLAKRIKDRGKDVKIGIYDWDDSCEDEGGGDIYRRRKEDFSEGETRRSKSLPRFQKTKVRLPNDDKDGEEKLSIPNIRKTAVHSDSLGMHNQKVRDNTTPEARRQLERNLGNELDEPFNTNCSAGEMEPEANADAQELLDVGLDTQMAAQAMEALCNAEDVANDGIRVTRSSFADQLNNSSTGKVGPVTSRECSRQFEKKRKVEVKSDLQTSALSKKCAKEVEPCRRDCIMTRSKRSKLDGDGNRTSSANENGRVALSPPTAQRKSAGALKRLELGELNYHDSSGRGSGRSIVNERRFLGDVFHFTPVACRTRKSLAANQSIQPEIPFKSLREEDVEIDSLERSCGIGLQTSKALDPNSTRKASTVSVSNEFEMDTSDCPRRRRSLRISKLSDHNKGSEKLASSSKPSAQPEDIGKSTAGKRKMRTDGRTVVKSRLNCQTRSSSYGGLVTSVDQEQGKVLQPNFDEENPGDTSVHCIVIAGKDANLNSDGKNNADVRMLGSNFEVTSSNESPRDRYKSSDLTSPTPANCRMPVNDASPVCMGDGYYKQSCNINFSRSCLHKICRKELQRELRSLSTIKPELTTPSKDSRKRRDMIDVRILYSHHLDEDIIKHQKKILARLGISVASSIADATHFIANQFVRTRNMLEAIAFGKPVVTHSWIESCGQASCFIDERNYILRDAKKEKEFGFSMPLSLARASQHPLLEGRRVLITPNAKPSKEIISSLVKAVQGQAVERIGRSVWKDNRGPDDLLILSCEEDYASCEPFLEKGTMVYSSELLLNGIVVQKLDYERHRLFADHVKKTRSTIWLKKDDRTFLPVTKCI